MLLRFIVPILLAVLLAAAGPAGNIPFDLAKPSRIYVLPEELMEVSALTDVDDRTVACLQDEAATMYFFDLVEGRVTRKVPFGVPGDMEGLTRVKDSYYALRSDGLVYHLTVGADRALVSDTFRLAVPEHNIEGLGYDEKRGLILVSPKDVIKGRPEMRDRRVIHAYDPARHSMAGTALTLSVTSIVAQARKAGFEVPMRTTDKGRVVPALKLRFSSVALDPVSDRYYILSAVDHMLLVVDRQGGLAALHQLDAKLFPKPEGITFLPSGTLLISNEGKGATPNILRFDRR